MENKIQEYHELLNREGSYPGTYLRRNHVMYPLVCYINNIVCLYISKNYTPIPLFISRAYKHLIDTSNFEGNTGEEELTKKYRQLVLGYITKMAEHVLTLNIDQSHKDLLPKNFFE